MSVHESVQRISGRPLPAPKRSSYVVLALMGTASFAASFAAGSAFLNWKSPVGSAAAASQQSCTTNADGTQTCPRSASAWRSGVFYYVPWPRGSDAPNRSAPSPTMAKLSAGETPAAQGSRTGDGNRSGDVKRSGFGSRARTVSLGRISVGG